MAIPWVLRPKKSLWSRLHARRDSRNDIDRRISLELGYAPLDPFSVHTKELPSYRFVDLHRAVQTFAQTRGQVRLIDSEHNQEDLNSILHGPCPQWVSRKIKRAGRTAWPVSIDEEIYLPVDGFWICHTPVAGYRDHLIMRLRYDPHSERATLEVAAVDSTAAEKAVEGILNESVGQSIYRGSILELAYEAGTKDEYGDVERAERLRVLFKRSEPMQDSDFVIDEEVRQVLWRNTIDIHQRRDLLKATGVPVRRGVLLYGPPGTGKTFACRYICGKLPNTTRIIVTGSALLQIKAMFSLARMLQPALLILEDVDLIFASREINLYSSALGDLLDHMDGLRPHEDISFVLTTNAIERMEAAIKDRPGRVSQCIYFGPPQAELRGRYLRHYLRGYDSSNLTIDRLVAQSNGATQAFLKEWVHRAVQISSERLQEGSSTVQLHDQDFEAALNEMRKFSGGSTGKIIGFYA